MKNSKMIAILLACAILLGAVGCSQSPVSEPVATTAGATNTASETAAPQQQTETDKQIVIGIGNCSDTDLYCKLVTDRIKGMIEEAHPEWEVLLTAANMDPSIQLEQVQSYIARKVDLIIITAADADGSVSSVEAAYDAGIPIITFINPTAADQEKRIFIGASNVLCGEGIAKLLADALPENAKVCIMEGTPGHINGGDRVNGFNSKIAELRPDVEILASTSGYFEREKALQVAQDWIQAYPQIDAIMCANDEMGLGVVEALRAADRLDECKVASVDGIAEALQSIKDGDMYSSMFQNYITQCDVLLEVVEDILINGNMKPDDFAIEFDAVTSENVDYYIENFN